MQAPLPADNHTAACSCRCSSMALCVSPADVPHVLIPFSLLYSERTTISSETVKSTAQGVTERLHVKGKINVLTTFKLSTARGNLYLPRHRAGAGRRTKPLGRRPQLDGSNRISSPPTRYLTSESHGLFLAREVTEPRNKSPGKGSGAGRGLGPGGQGRRQLASAALAAEFIKLVYAYFFFLPSLLVSPSHV